MLHAIEHPKKFTENMVDKQNKYIVGGARWGGNKEDATDMLNTLKDSADDSIKKVNIEKYKNAEFSVPKGKKFYKFVEFSQADFVNFMETRGTNQYGFTPWGDAGNVDKMRENNQREADVVNNRLKQKYGTGAPTKYSSSGRSGNVSGSNVTPSTPWNSQVSYRNADGSIKYNYSYYQLPLRNFLNFAKIETDGAPGTGNKVYRSGSLRQRAMDIAHKDREDKKNNPSGFRRDFDRRYIITPRNLER